MTFSGQGTYTDQLHNYSASTILLHRRHPGRAIVQQRRRLGGVEIAGRWMVGSPNRKRQTRCRDGGIGAEQLLTAVLSLV